MQSVSIVGVGRVGGALALALSQKGFPVENLVYRSRISVEKLAPHISPRPSLFSKDSTFQLNSDIVFITTSDPDIDQTASDLFPAIRPGSAVLHTSGSLSSEVLNCLRAKNIHVGSAHPLVSISDPFIGASRFDGAYFCIEGDVEAVKAASNLAAALGGIPFSIAAENKPLYHASAVTASGHLVALEDMAVEMLSKCGIELTEAKKILIPLIKSTVDNLVIQSNHEALTGTFARADVPAYERHMSAFKGKIEEDVIEIYLLLAERSLALAEQRGADAGMINDLLERIKIAKKNL